MHIVKMENIDNNTPEITEVRMTSKQRKRLYETMYYRVKYQSDPEYRKSEIERNSSYIKVRYQNDPEFRQRMIDNAKARYYARKAAAAQ